jgi:hypothetical protein
MNSDSLPECIFMHPTLLNPHRPRHCRAFAVASPSHPAIHARVPHSSRTLRWVGWTPSPNPEASVFAAAFAVCRCFCSLSLLLQFAAAFVLAIVFAIVSASSSSACHSERSEEPPHLPLQLSLSLLSHQPLAEDSPEAEGRARIHEYRQKNTGPKAHNSTEGSERSERKSN